VPGIVGADRQVGEAVARRGGGADIGGDVARVGAERRRCGQRQRDGQRQQGALRHGRFLYRLHHRFTITALPS
jgi:hypothetical protein